MIRSNRKNHRFNRCSNLCSAPLATLTIVSLLLLGCGSSGGGGSGGSGGGEAGSGGGSAGKGGNGAAGKGGAGGSATGGAAGSTAGQGGSGGSATGGEAGSAAGAGGSATGGAAGSAAGAGGSATGGAAGSAAGAGGSATGGAAGSAAGAGGSATGGAAGSAAGAGGSATGGAAGSTAGAGGSVASCPTGNACTTSSNESGVCANNACAACGSDAACVGAYGTGLICINGTGCVAGDCHDTNADCTGGQVCLAHSCSPCTTDAQCGNDHLCISGACVAGNCRTTPDCPTSGGLVCINMACSPCTVDSQCAPYGADICVSNVCTPGNCHSTGDCNSANGDAGQVCNLSTHTCTACSSDAQCADPANYNTGHFCQSNVCVAGQCRTASDCSGGQLCNASLQCVPCSTTPDCTAALGANHVCQAGACVAGNCNTTADCVSSGQLCQGTTCAGCNADTDCTGDPAYGAQHICFNHACVAGNCHASSDCVNSQQLCNTGTHMCTGCGSDTACQTDPSYGSTTICLNADCVQGNCHDTSNDCSNGQICGASTAHTCGACTTDTECKQDGRYGSGDICYLSSCSPGNCHGTSGDCIGANAGLICGASVANTCGTCSTDTQCKSDTTYGSGTICETTAGTTQGECVTASCSASGACSANGGDFCCSSSCVPGNCCVDADCGSFGTACVSHTCSACNAVSGNKFFVDPVNGNDSTATGSDMAGTAVAPGCAFKTVARAIQAIPPTPPVGTQIVIVGSSSGPTDLVASDLQTAAAAIILPANTTLTTTGGAITITLKTQANKGTASGFQLQNNGSGLAGTASAPLTLNGNGHAAGIGIIVNPSAGSTNTFNISSLTIENVGGIGIRVNAGNLNIGAGVVVTGSTSDGLLAAAGTANINNATGAQTLFTQNGASGIEASGTGSVNVVGAAGAPVPSDNGTVVSNFNTAAGLRIDQTPGAAGLALNSINGLVSWANSQQGALLFGGSQVKIRNSVLLGNVSYGVQVSSNGNTTAADNDVSGMDLGTSGDPGHNYLQTPLGALGVNSSGGLCVALTNYAPAVGQPLTLTETLTAAGNELVSGTSQVDCSTTSATVTQGTCGGMRSIGINVATNITTSIGFAMCM